MFGAFRYRDFRIFWTGAFVSNIGSWMQTIALNWLVLQITGSAFALGVVSFAGTAPILALSLVGGVFVDRMDRKVVLRVTQSVLLVLAFALALLTEVGLARIEYIVIISLLTGVVTAANSPAWQTFVVDLVEKEDLPTAVALSSTQFNLSRVVGPSIAGIVLAVAGAAACFFANAVSFLAVVVALFLVRPRTKPRRPEVGSIWKRLQAGLAYAAADPVVRPLVTQTAAVTVFGFPYALLMPVMAQQVLGLDASGYGAMMSATGVGAIVGSLSVASWGRWIPRGRLLVVGELGFSLSLIGFSAARSLVVALGLLGVLGCCMIVYMTSANTSIQISSPEELRGRVMSIWTLVSFGLTPVGSLLAGAIAERWGAPVALGLGGVVCAMVGIATASTNPTLVRLPTGVART
jgi:MFS family permease